MRRGPGSADYTRYWRVYRDGRLRLSGNESLTPATFRYLRGSGCHGTGSWGRLLYVEGGRLVSQRDGGGLRADEFLRSECPAPPRPAWAAVWQLVPVPGRTSSYQLRNPEGGGALVTYNQTANVVQLGRAPDDEAKFWYVDFEPPPPVPAGDAGGGSGPLGEDGGTLARRLGAVHDGHAELVAGEGWEPVDGAADDGALDGAADDGALDGAADNDAPPNAHDGGAAPADGHEPPAAADDAALGAPRRLDVSLGALSPAADWPFAFPRVPPMRRREVVTSLDDWAPGKAVLVTLAPATALHSADADGGRRQLQGRSATPSSTYTFRAGSLARFFTGTDLLTRVIPIIQYAGGNASLAGAALTVEQLYEEMLAKAKDLLAGLREAFKAAGVGDSTPIEDALSRAGFFNKLAAEGFGTGNTRLFPQSELLPSLSQTPAATGTGTATPNDEGAGGSVVTPTPTSGETPTPVAPPVTASPSATSSQTTSRTPTTTAAATRTRSVTGTRTRSATATRTRTRTRTMSRRRVL